MVNYKFKRAQKPEKNTWRSTSRSEVKTLPAQSFTVQEIVERYAKGIPVDVVKRQGVYVDQSEHDLEKLSRMDFSEKAEMAEGLRQHHQEVSEAIKADKQAKHERAKKQKEQSERSGKAAEGSAGIDSLDNTMPDDTSLNPK